jgi:hypothetical protein
VNLIGPCWRKRSKKPEETILAVSQYVTVGADISNIIERWILNGQRMASSLGLSM